MTQDEDSLIFIAFGGVLGIGLLIGSIATAGYIGSHNEEKLFPVSLSISYPLQDCHDKGGVFIDGECWKKVCTNWQEYMACDNRDSLGRPELRTVIPDDCTKIERYCAEYGLRLIP